jgi:hypothetical protein
MDVSLAFGAAFSLVSSLDLQFLQIVGLASHVLLAAMLVAALMPLVNRLLGLLWSFGGQFSPTAKVIVKTAVKLPIVVALMRGVIEKLPHEDCEHLTSLGLGGCPRLHRRRPALVTPIQYNGGIRPC